MEIKNIFFIFFMLSYQLMFAQNVDNLMEVYMNTSNQLDKYELSFQLSDAYEKNKQMDSAVIFSDQAIALAETFEEKQYKGDAYLQRGDLAYWRQDYEKSDSFTQLSILTRFLDMSIVEKKTIMYS